MLPMRPHRPLDRDHVHEHGDHDLHGRAHGHAPASFGSAFAVGIGLNLTFVAVEFSYGVLANSVALMADAGHNLSDVLGLAIAWIASVLTRRAPSSRYTCQLRADEARLRTKTAGNVLDRLERLMAEQRKLIPKQHLAVSPPAVPPDVELASGNAEGLPREVEG